MSSKPRGIGFFLVGLPMLGGRAYMVWLHETPAAGLQGAAMGRVGLMLISAGVAKALNRMAGAVCLVALALPGLPGIIHSCSPPSRQDCGRCAPKIGQ